MKALLSLLLSSGLLCVAADLPKLEKRGKTTQLIVDGKPFLMMGAELHNSSSSSLEYMGTVWSRLRGIPLNTVLTPLSWELIEPREGQFDFKLVDGLIEQAREQKLRIVFLWLAAWKNGMSSYAPVWIKSDTRRFPRVVIGGEQVEILSTFGSATVEADSRAFRALMKHIGEIDKGEQTVLMMQVENEVGVLGATRDHSRTADAAFAAPVPRELIRYLQERKDELYPDLRELWLENGAKTSGNWEEVFGASSRADEIFMAWNYASYVQKVTAAGKAAYNLPMYVNTWLAQQDALPGTYPSGGPQPRVVDIWKAAGHALDIYTPDIYLPNFTEWCKRYTYDGNPLFIPETNGGATGAANAFYAFGESRAIGFSPFGIDSWGDKDNELGASYRVLLSIAPAIAEHQASGDIHGFTLDRDHSAVTFVMNGYQAEVSLDQVFNFHSEKGFGLIMADGKDGFLGAGRGFRVRFAPRANGPQAAGIESIEEGTYDDGVWKPGRRLNGDESDQGKYWRFDPRETRVERARLYRYE